MKNILVTLSPGNGDYGLFIPAEVAKKIDAMGKVVWNKLNRQFSSDELREKIRDMDICITGWGCPRLDEHILNNANSLKLVAHTGGSAAPLVSDYLYDQGIRVISGNKLYAESVAEGTITYILCALRNIPNYSQDMKNGVWRTNIVDEGLFDQTLGIVGFGMVAKYLVKMLKPFRVKIKAYDPFVKDETLKEYGVKKASLEEIFTKCKIISLHAPRTPDTYHIINRRLLEMIPEGTILINTARGSLIDEAALTDELLKKRFKAVLDVYEVEPLPAESRLRELDNVILTPHMAGPTIDRRKNVTLALLDDIDNFFTNGKLDHEISREYAMAMTR